MRRSEALSLRTDGKLQKKTLCFTKMWFFEDIYCCHYINRFLKVATRVSLREKSSWINLSKSEIGKQFSIWIKAGRACYLFVELKKQPQLKILSSGINDWRFFKFYCMLERTKNRINLSRAAETPRDWRCILLTKWMNE